MRGLAPPQARKKRLAKTKIEEARTQKGTRTLNTSWNDKD